MLSYPLGIAATGCQKVSCGKRADPLMVSLKRERGWADTAHVTDSSPASVVSFVSNDSGREMRRYDADSPGRAPCGSTW